MIDSLLTRFDSLPLPVQVLLCLLLLLIVGLFGLGIHEASWGHEDDEMLDAPDERCRRRRP